MSQVDGETLMVEVRNEVASIIYRYSKDGIISNNAEIFNQSPFQNGLMPKLSITNWRIERLRAILYPFIRHSRFEFTAKAAIDLVISHVDCVGGQKKILSRMFRYPPLERGEREFDNLATIHHHASPYNTRFSFVRYFSPWPSSVLESRPTCSDCSTVLIGFTGNEC